MLLSNITPMRVPTQRPGSQTNWRLMRQCITGAAQDDFVDKISASPKTGSWQWILAMLLERACTQGCSETTARQIMEVCSDRLFKDGKIHRMLLETLLLLLENQNLTGPSKEQLLLKLIAPLQKKVLENAEGQKIPSREAINKLGAEEKKALKTQMNAQKSAKKVNEKESIYLFIEGTSHLLALLAINDPMIKEVNDNRSLRDLMQASFEKLLPLQDKANFGEKYLSIFGQSRFPDALPVYAAKLKTLNDDTVLKDLALFVESVLNGTFLQLRHSCDKNPHLQQIAKEMVPRNSFIRDGKFCGHRYRRAYRSYAYRDRSYQKLSTYQWRPYAEQGAFGISPRW